MKIIDAHIHYCQQTVPGKSIIANMDACNVEKSIVLATPDHPRYTLAGLTGNNAEVSKVCREFPDRLIPALYVEPRNIMEAQTAIRRFYDQGGRFLKMWPGHGFSPDDPMIYPVWEVVNELKMAVIFHSGSLGISPHLPLDVRRSDGFNAKFGRPFLLDQPGRYFSDIRFIIAHGGYPWTLEALEMAHMFKHIYIDFSCGLGLEAYNLINRLRPGRIPWKKFLFGSDTAGSPKEYIETWMEMMQEPFFADHAEGFFYENAARLISELFI